MRRFEITEEHCRQYDRDGFLIVREPLLDDAEVALLRGRFEPLFRGEFETGLYPDEWNWQEGRDAPDLTRQICNGWRSDHAVARIVLSETVGEICARLSGWPGARIAQDNVLWKPPAARALGHHQDAAYCHWMVPCAMTTCWIALDDTRAEAGTIEYVRGSHKWGDFGPIRKFHAPENYREAVAAAAAAVGVEPEYVPIEVPAGGFAIHHGYTFHGSGVNRAAITRRSVVAHTMSSETRYHPVHKSYIYNRYKRVGDEAMDESFFPILWREDGYRTPWLNDYCRQGSARALAE